MATAQDRKGKITAIFHFEGMKRIEIQEAHAGDIVGLTGFEDVFIGETITRYRRARSRCPSCRSIRRRFRCSSQSTTARWPGRTASSSPRAISGSGWSKKSAPTSPCASRRPSDPNIFDVSGRGEMQIAILVEQMRREGHEVLVSRPEVHLSARTTTAICSSRSKSCSWKFRRKPWATSWKTSPAAKREITNMNHHRRPGQHRGADPDARPDRL